MSSYLKGLGDRISSKEDSFTKEINIDKLIPSNKNFYRINEIDELANSIKESGLMHNLVVREIKENQGFYEILSGERRYMALKSLNYKMVPCRVIKMNDFDAEIALINANAKTRELTHIEKMEGIKRLKEIYTLKKSNGEAPKGKTRDLIGNDIGMSGVQVGRYMKVAEKLSDEFKEMLNKDEITLTQAIDLSNLSKDEQHDIYVNIRGVSKDEAKILIEGIKQPVENEKDKELIPIKQQEEKSVPIESSENKVSTLEDLNQFKFEAIKKLLEKDKKPKLVLNGPAYGILETKSVLLEDNTFTISIEGGNVKIKLDFYYARRVPYINYIDERLTTDNAWMINSDVYIWFNNEN